FDSSHLPVKHAQNNIESCTVIGWTFKNCFCKRLAHLRWTNPKTKYSLAHISDCIRQTLRETGDEVANAQQKFVAPRAGNNSIARRRAFRLSRMVLMKKENIPYRTIETYRLIDVNVAESAKTVEHDLLRVGGT